MAGERVRFRYGTTAQWAATERTLQMGEGGVEYSTGGVLVGWKLGEQNKPWDELPYQGVDLPENVASEAFVTGLLVSLIGSMTITMNWNAGTSHYVAPPTFAALTTALAVDPGDAHRRIWVGPIDPVDDTGGAGALYWTAGDEITRTDT